MGLVLVLCQRPSWPSTGYHLQPVTLLPWFCGLRHKRTVLVRQFRGRKRIQQLRKTHSIEKTISVTSTWKMFTLRGKMALRKRLERLRKAAAKEGTHCGWKTTQIWNSEYQWALNKLFLLMFPNIGCENKLCVDVAFMFFNKFCFDCNIFILGMKVI